MEREINNIKSENAKPKSDIPIKVLKWNPDIIVLGLTECYNQNSYDSIVPWFLSLRNGIFPVTWKMANIISVHKKETKNIVKTYRPISLFPIFGKVFERLLFNSLCAHFHDNDLFSKCQSGFMPGDSQLLVYPNFFPQYMKFNHHLIIIHQLIQELYS